MTVTVLTGASSGIGAALALRLAQKPGAVLGLVAREETRLRAVAAACIAAGATVVTATIDVRDTQAMAVWLTGFDEHYPVDGVIANAGVSAGTLAHDTVEREDQAHAIFAVNVTGTLNTALPLVPRLKARGQGRIVFMSSLAAFAPVPEHAAYSASKAALLALGLAWRAKLRADGIVVQVICPGFVTTPMSAKLTGWKPQEISATDAAVRIERGLNGSSAVVAFPFALAALSRLTRLLPESVNRAGLKLFRF